LITYGFLAVVVLAAFYTLNDWRTGVVLWLFVAILQDPIRKITPDSPVYLTLSFVPIYAAAFIGLLNKGHKPTLISRRFRNLDNTYKLLVLCVLCSFVLVLLSGIQSPVRSLIGATSYIAGIPAIVMGYFFCRNGYQALDRLLMCFVAITSLMLVGVPLEHNHYEFSLPWLGTINHEGGYRRWYSNTEWVDMISGFHRSPEIMGWHAMMLGLICLYFVVRKPGKTGLWLSLGVWASYAVFLSGRRKMLLMMIVFLAVFPLVSGFKSRRKIVLYLVPAVLLAIPGIVWLVDDTYLMSFSTGLDMAGAKVAEKGVVGPWWLLGLVGPFGYGVGTITQGGQHFGTAIDVPLVEGGLEKIMVELGLIGTVSAMLFGYCVIWTAMDIVKKTSRLQSSEIAPAFCFAMLMANLSAFMIAFQFLGDPFIATFVGFMYGVLLSAAPVPAATNRLEAEEHVRMNSNRAPEFQEQVRESGGTSIADLL
jgi:hypothetical protein